MAQVDPHGYAQATRMLAGGSLVHDLAQISCPITVASGNMDTITPPGGCNRAATAARTTLIDVGPVGHACALEAAEAVNRLLAGAMA
jgi:pimeloyl-ACP methyl ester carboxylesterase